MVHSNVPTASLNTVAEIVICTNDMEEIGMMNLIKRIYTEDEAEIYITLSKYSLKCYNYLYFY